MKRWDICWWDMPRYKQNQYIGRNRIGGIMFNTHRCSSRVLSNNEQNSVDKPVLPHCSTRSQTPQESRLAGGEGLRWCQQLRQSQRGCWRRSWKGSWWKVCQMMLDFAMAAETRKEQFDKLTLKMNERTNEWRIRSWLFYEGSERMNIFLCRSIRTHTSLLFHWDTHLVEFLS